MSGATAVPTLRALLGELRAVCERQAELIAEQEPAEESDDDGDE